MTSAIYVGTELFFSQITLLSCLHGALRAVTQFDSLCPASFRFFHAPASLRAQKPLCPAMINHAYFCVKSAFQIGVLITIRISRVKLSAENVQKMNQPQLPVYQERRKGAERTRALLTDCIPRSLRWSMLNVPTMFPAAKTKNKI